VVRTPEHQFIRYLAETYKHLPDDSFYENINPYLRIWLYEGWIHDKEQHTELLRNVAIFLGSFINPEMAHKLVKKENPDFTTTDLDTTSKMVRESILEEDNKKRKKKRKVING
jgi:hypothetical protein